MPERVTPLRLCTIVDSDGETIQPYVRCPRRNETIDALACTGCSRMRSLEWDPSRGGEVTCTVVEANEPAKIDRRADLGELASRVLLHEVVAPTNVCVKSDLPLSQLKHVVKEKGARSVAVVDDERKLVGLLSLVDLSTAPDFGCVADITSPHVHPLLDDSPLAHAIALMATEGVSEVPVVRADGTFIGVYYAIDALRWVAGRMGYVIREPARPSTDSLSKEGPP
jgi:CBS domain-containing protein